MDGMAKAILRAVEVAGGPTALQRALGERYQSTVSNWLARGRCPAERVLAMERATGYRVSRHELRPDIYPREPWCRCPACERARAEAPRSPAEEGEAA